MAFVSCIIPTLSSAWGLWFTFIYRTHEHHAVEDFISKDLLALVGTHILWSPCIPHLYLDYITNLAICQDLFEFLRKGWDLNPLGIASRFTAGTISPTIEKPFLFVEVMVGLVPPSQELGRSRTALPPFPSRLPRLSLLPLCPYCITL